MRIVIEGYVEKFVVPGIKRYIEFFSRGVVLSTVINDNLNGLNV